MGNRKEVDVVIKEQHGDFCGDGKIQHLDCSKTRDQTCYLVDKHTHVIKLYHITHKHPAPHTMSADIPAKYQKLRIV